MAIHRMVPALMAVVLASRVAAAQRVHGAVRDGLTNAPVPGAVVWLADSAGTPLSRGIGDASGRFTVMRSSRAAIARIVRIGYLPREVALVAGDTTTTLDVRLDPLPALLAPLAASPQRVCPGDRQLSEGLALWEQARAALLAGVVAREAQPPKVRLIAFNRTREPVLHQTTSQHTTMKDQVADRSYVAALPAWAFASQGYMREEGGERVFYAPDNETLLDATFATTHCLSVARADRAHEGQVGIAFEPADAAERDTLVDIRGVLWMDRDRPALRSIEFSYTNLEPLARESGGEIVFASLPNGAPLVHHWTIRTVLLATDARTDDVRRAPAPRNQRKNVRHIGDREVGGELAAITWPDGSEWHAPLPRVVGVVQDDAGQGIAGARVWMLNTTDTVTSSAEGRFALPYVTPGVYALLASDSVLARAGVARTPATWLRLDRAGDVELALPLHPRAEVLRILCEGQAYRPDAGVVLGQVLDSAGAPRPFAKIDLFRHIMMGNAELFTQDPGGQAGSDGRFVICGATPSEQLRIRATSVSDVGEVTLREWRDNVLAARLVLRSP